MGISIQKPGQGYWTRVGSAAGAAIIVLAAAHWMYNDQLAGQHLYLRLGIALGIIAVCSAVLFFIMNKPHIVDFFIATEAEMKKVNWPTKKDIVGSTWIVICGTFLFAALMFVVDIAFSWLFIQINIIEAGSK